MSDENPIKPDSTVEIKKEGETFTEGKLGHLPGSVNRFLDNKSKALDEQIAELDPNCYVWIDWDEGTKKGYLIALQNTKRITGGK